MRLFETLNRRVQQEVKGSLYKNETFLRGRWGIIDRNVICWATRYWRYSLLTLLLAILLGYCLNELLPLLYACVENAASDTLSLQKLSGTILAGQLTVIGVIYPLVLAMVNLLFQTRSGKTALFHVYRTYSGFMFSGLSGLFLAIFVVFTESTLPIFPTIDPTAFHLTSVFWFIANLLLVIRFFVATFQMLNETEQKRIVFRFFIHEICEPDIRQSIKNIILKEPVLNGLVVNPKPQLLELIDFTDSLRIRERLTNKNCSVKLTKRKRSVNAEVENVWYWLINAAIYTQILTLQFDALVCNLRTSLKSKMLELKCKYPYLKRLQKNRQESDLIVQTQVDADNLTARKLMMRLDVQQATITLAEYQGYELNRCVKWAIRLAYVLGESTNELPHSIPTTIKALTGPAHDALRNSFDDEFEVAMDNMLDWHITLSESLFFKDKNGKQTSWMLFRSGADSFRNRQQEFLKEYYRIGRSAIEKIPENSSFYSITLRLFRRIYVKRETLLRAEKEALLEASYQMWHFLMEWRSLSSSSEDLRVASKYADILMIFIEQWENWLLLFDSPARTSQEPQVLEEYPELFQHLELTALATNSAMKYGNVEALEWALDMLIKWEPKPFLNENFRKTYTWNKSLINPSLLSLSLGEPPWPSILQGGEVDHESIYKLAFFNMQTDLILLVACNLLLKANEAVKPKVAVYVKALLEGSSLKSGGRARIVVPIDSLSELMICYTRQRDHIRKSAESYGGLLASLLHRFDRIDDERRVSGRIYSGEGADDVHRFVRVYVQIGLYLSRKKWQPPFSYESLVLSDAFSQQNRDTIIWDFQNWIQEAESLTESVLIEDSELQACKQNFTNTLNRLIKKLQEHQDLKVNDAQVDKERLNQLGEACSLSFSQESRGFYPLSFFARINDNENLLPDEYARTLQWNNYPKERLALGLNINRPVNEEEIFQEEVFRDIKNTILSKLVSHRIQNTFDYESNDVFIKKVGEINKAESRDNPILFVGDPEVWQFLNSCRYDSSLGEGHDICGYDGYGEDYICHIGDCEVRRLGFSDVDYNILTFKNVFAELTFQKDSEERYVLVDFELDKDQPLIGTLSLKYWIKIVLDKSVPTYKLKRLDEIH